MRTKQAGVDGGVPNATAPSGGFGQSGYDREFGLLGTDEPTVITSLQSACSTGLPGRRT